MKENHKIDELFLKALADYSSELPSENTKKKIFGKLAYYQYLKWSLSVLGLIFVTGTIWAIYNFLPNSVDNQLNNIPFKSNNKTESKIINQEQKTEKSKEFTTNYIVNESAKTTTNNNQIVAHKIEKYKQVNISSNEVNSTTDIKTIVSAESDNEINNDKKIVDVAVEESKIFSTVTSDKNEDKLTQSTIKSVENKKEEDLKPASQKLTDENANVDGLIKKEYKKRNISRLELIAGADFYYVDKKLSSVKEYDNLVKIRKENEKPILAFSPSFGLRYNFNNFFVQSGFQYQKYGENTDIQTNELKFNVNENWFHRDSLYYVKDSVNPPGAWHIDTIWYVNYDTTHFIQKYRFQKNNTYHYIEIPVMIGKKFDFNPFILEVSTGISFGLILKSNSEILAPDTRSVIVLNNEKSAYFNQLMLNYLFRLSLRYNLSQKWSIYVSPNIKYNLGNVFNNSYYPVKQNYILYGVGSGIIYKF